MKVKVVGFRSVKFKDEKTGNEVNGKSLFVTYPGHDVEGVEAAKIFAPARILDDSKYNPKVGDAVDLVFNQKGRLVGVVQL